MLKKKEVEKVTKEKPPDVCVVLVEDAAEDQKLITDLSQRYARYFTRLVYLTVLLTMIDIFPGW